MTIEVSLFGIILLIVFINTVLDHLLNWAIRDVNYDGFIFFIYFIKTVILVTLLSYYII